MNRYIFLITFTLFFCTSSLLFGQEEITSSEEDSKYREDQFYAGVTYNLLSAVPSGVNLNGVSGGLNFGYMRDMPINERRNVALAIGAGFAFDQLGQTLFIGEDANDSTIFRVLDNSVIYTRNRLSIATVEVPLEFRWRSSTAEEFKFWRIYGGIRAGYGYWIKASFKQTGNEVTQTDIPEFERLRLGATLSFGYSTFNFYTYYSLNPFFNDAQTIDGQPIDFKAFKVGIIFYIL
jgi:hypothetical protein